jgi:hypothetical protein
VSTTITVLSVAGALAAVIGFAVWLGRRRRTERNARRIAALVAVAERIDAAVSSLGETAATLSAEHGPLRRPVPGAPTPLVDDGLPGRAALLDAVADAVDQSRAKRSRLSAAVVRVTGEKDAGALAGVVHEVARAEAYAVGPRSVALVLPGLGRADALGVLARIEAQCSSSGRAVELEPREDAVEFAARLLAGQAGESVA